MAWLDSTFQQRLAITVNNGAAGDTIDGELVLPKDDDGFWTAIDSSGNELRITAADGVTPLDYDVDNGSGGAFNRTSRLGRVQIDGIPVISTSRAALLWLYFDTASTVGDGSTSVSVSSAQTCTIEQGHPGQLVIPVTRGRLDATRPVETFAKDPDDELHVWFDFTEVLENGARSSQGRRQLEEIRRATYEVVDDTGTPDNSMRDLDGLRFLEVANLGNHRRMFVRCPILGGTDGERYTIRCTVSTVNPGMSPSTHRLFTASAGCAVRALLEV